MDVVDTRTRSRMMAGIRGANTAPEIVVRRALHRAGFRFRLNVRELPGKPDIVLPKHRAAIFVHGCFWHRHEGCRYTAIPATRPDFWAKKFDRNVERDNHAVEALRKGGWRVAILWECATRAFDETYREQLFGWLRSGGDMLIVGEAPQD